MKDKIICGLIISAIIALATACNTERRVNDWSIKNPDKFKQLAAVLAPCVDLNPKIDTLYQLKTDTLITAGRSDTVKRNDTLFITRQLPGKTIVKTQIQTVTKTVADSRALEAEKIKTSIERDRANKAETKLEQSDKSNKNKTWWIIGLAVALALAVATHFVNPLGWLKGVVK